MNIRSFVIVCMASFALPLSALAVDKAMNNSVATGIRLPVVNKADLLPISQAYPNGSPVRNAQREALNRFLTSFESAPSLAQDYGEVQLDRSDKSNSQCTIHVVKLPNNIQRRLSFLDSVVLVALPGKRLFDDVAGELFPFGLNTGKDLPEGLQYRTDAVIEQTKKELKISDKNLVLIQAIPRRILTAFPGLFTEQDLESISNFRTMKPRNVTLSAVKQLRAPWIQLLLSARKPTRQEIEKIRDMIDFDSSTIKPLVASP